MNCRIVFNEQTERYRIERRGLLGWNFVTDEASGKYLSFADLADAKAWVRDHASDQSPNHRRWKVIYVCPV